MKSSSRAVMLALTASGSRISRIVNTAGVAEERSNSTSWRAAPTKATTASCALSIDGALVLKAAVATSILTVNTFRNRSPGL